MDRSDVVSIATAANDLGLVQTYSPPSEGVPFPASTISSFFSLCQSILESNVVRPIHGLVNAHIGSA